MKRIEIEIMRSSDALNAVIDTWHKVEAGKHALRLQGWAITCAARHCLLPTSHPQSNKSELP